MLQLSCRTRERKEANFTPLKKDNQFIGHVQLVHRVTKTIVFPAFEETSFLLEYTPYRQHVYKNVPNTTSITYFQVRRELHQIHYAVLFVAQKHASSLERVELDGSIRDHFHPIKFSISLRRLSTWIHQCSKIKSLDAALFY